MFLVVTLDSPGLNLCLNIEVGPLISQWCNNAEINILADHKHPPKNHIIYGHSDEPTYLPMVSRTHCLSDSQVARDSNGEKEESSLKNVFVNKHSVARFLSEVTLLIWLIWLALLWEEGWKGRTKGTKENRTASLRRQHLCFKEGQNRKNVWIKM